MLFWVLKLHYKPVGFFCFVFLWVKWDSTKMVICSATCVFSGEHIQISSTEGYLCLGAKISVSYSDLASTSDFNGKLKTINVLDHWSSCLHAGSEAQLKTRPSEVCGLGLFSPRLAANARRAQISLSDVPSRTFLWDAVDFSSSGEQSNIWSVQRVHTSGAVSPMDSGYCLGPSSSEEETKVRDICAWRWICGMRQDEIVMVRFD